MNEWVSEREGESASREEIVAMRLFNQKTLYMYNTTSAIDQNFMIQCDSDSLL